jgi:bifunctional non-homologous end joining protein LigD
VMQMVVIEGRLVRLTNLDKPMWSGLGVTKGELLHYLAEMASVLLPHWRGRPMTVTRYPEGVEGSFFYQKNCPAGAPDWVQTHNWNGTRYVLVNDLSTLMWLGNQGVVEFHPAEFLAGEPESSSYAVIDLDPTSPLGFEAAVEVALRCHEVLLQLDLKGYPKTSGATGIHVYVPLRSGYGFDVTAALAKTIGLMLQKAVPHMVTLERRIKLRRGVYVDYLQNAPSKTLVGVYSPRPTPAATVSTPVTWEELAKIHPEEFTIRTVPQRVREVGDLFAEVLTCGQSLHHLLPILASR